MQEGTPTSSWADWTLRRMYRRPEGRSVARVSNCVVAHSTLHAAAVCVVPAMRQCDIQSALSDPEMAITHLERHRSRLAA